MEDLSHSEIIYRKAYDQIQESIPKPEDLKDLSYEELKAMPEEQRKKLFSQAFKVKN